MNAETLLNGAPDICTDALAQAPFAALIFRVDADFTLLWRNTAHAAMSSSVNREVIGQGMFEAFPPNTSDGGDAAVDAIRVAVDALIEGAPSADIGPFRFDLPNGSGDYVEHRWQMQMSPILHDNAFVAVLQVSQDVTARVLSQRVADTYRRSSRSVAAVSYFSYDPDTDLFIRGADVDEMFGFAPDTAGPCAAPFFARVAPEDLDGVQVEVARVFAAPRGDIASFDYRIDRPDGSARFVRIRAEVATDPADRREKLIGTFLDLTDVEQTRRRLEASLSTKDALITEANHRIKNSLQMALSMLRLEAGRLRGDPNTSVAAAIEAMGLTEARIRSVAAIHGLMRIDDSISNVDLDGLLSNLIDNIRHSTGISDAALVLSGPDYQGKLDSDTAIIFALIVNELVTNAIKFGWSEVQDHTISVVRFIDDDRLGVTIENSVLGSGYRSMAVSSTGLGADLVQSLLHQIGASLEQTETSGSFSVTLALAKTSAIPKAT